MLCTCCSSASFFEWDLFFKSVTLWAALQIPIWSKTHLVFRHKVYEIALSEVLPTQMRRSINWYQFIWTIQIWPIFASQRVDSAGTRAQTWLGLPVSSYSLLQHSRPAWLVFLSTTPHINEESKMPTALTPHLFVFDWSGNKNWWIIYIYILNLISLKRTTPWFFCQSHIFIWLHFV